MDSHHDTKIFVESDLIVVFGASISSHNSDQQKLWPNARVIQITLDPQQFFQGNTVSDQIIVGDTGQIVAELIPLVRLKTCVNRTDKNADLIQQTPIDDSDSLTYSDGLNPAQAVKEINQSVPADWQIVNSSGHCSYFVEGSPFEKFPTIRSLERSKRFVIALVQL